MTSPDRTRRCGALKLSLPALLISLGLAHAATPDPAELAASHCSHLARLPQGTTPMDWRQRLQDSVLLAEQALAPAAGKAQACAVLSSDAPDADKAYAWVQLARALTSLEGPGPAQLVLDAAKRVEPAWQGASASWLGPAWHVAQGEVHLLASNPAGARSALDAALHAMESGPLREGVWHAEALIGRSRLWRRENLHVQAADALQRAEQMLARLGLERSVQMESLENARGVLLYSTGRIEESLQSNERELALMRALGRADSAAALHPLISMASSLTTLSRFNEAHAVLETAEAMMRTLSDEQLKVDASAAVGVLQQRASLEIDRGRLDEAEQSALRALAMAQRLAGPGSPLVTRPLYRLGYAQMNQGRFVEAMNAFESALAVADTQPGSIPTNSRLQLAFGLEETLAKLGDHLAARQWRDKLGRELAARPISDYYKARLAKREAQESFDQQDWEQTLAQSSAAESLAATLGEDHPFVLDVRGQACIAALRLAKRPEQAEEPAACANLRTRLPLLETASAGLRFAVLSALAQAEDLRQRPTLARPLHVEALAAAMSVNSPVLLAPAYDALARHLRAAGGADAALAILLGKQAVEQIGRNRALLAEAGTTRRTVASWESVFDLPRLPVLRRVAGWLAEDGRYAESIHVLQALKQEEWFAFVRQPQPSPGEADWTAQEAHWMARRADWLKGDAVPLQQTPEPARQTREERSVSQQAAASARQQERQRAQALTLWLSESRQQPVAAVPSDGLAKQAKPQASAKPRGHPHEARLWYSFSDAGLVVIVSSRDSRTHLTLRLSERELAGRIGDLNSRMLRRAPVLELLQSLYADVLAPALSAIEGPPPRKLVLQLDGSLRHLPFAALHDGRDWIGSRFALEQRLAAPGQAGPTRPLQRLEGLGSSQGAADLPALPAVREELCALIQGQVHGLPEGQSCRREASAAAARRWPGEAWLDGSFDLPRLKRVLAGEPGRSPVTGLHLATHFKLRPGFMSRSWLQLGDGQRATLEQLASQAMGARPLVTLSACETAVGGSGAERDGLAGLFLRRGASQVVATLWPVEDRRSAQLLQALYASQPRDARVDAALALKRAQQDLRRQAGSEHPFYWAGFVALAADVPGTASSRLSR